MAIALMAMLITPPSGAHAASGDVVQYPTGQSGAISNVVGTSDGSIWFTVQPGFGAAGGSINRLSSGIVTTFPAPSWAVINSLVVGPDQNLWFAGMAPIGGLETCSLGRMSATGAYTEVTVLGVCPGQVLAAPDGLLWIVDGSGLFTATTVVTRITSAGNVVDKFSFAGFICGGTFGPGGSFWFTATAAAGLGGSPSIGTRASSGAVTEWPVSIADNCLWSPALASDGNLWFVDNGGGFVGKAAVSGASSGQVLATYPIPGAMPSPQSLVQGRDGNMWVVDTEWGGVSQVLRTTLGGVFSVFTPPTTQVNGGGSYSELIGSTIGADGNLWIGDDYGFVDRIEIDATPTCAGVIQGTTYRGNLSVPAGSTCTLGPHTIVTGNVTVGAGAALVVDGASIGGNLTGVGVQVSLLHGASVQGNVQLAGGGSLTMSGAAVRGNVQAMELGPVPSSICGTSIGGNLQLQRNVAQVSVGAPPSCRANVVNGNLEAQHNTSPTAPSISIDGNSVGGNLQCTGNTPAAVGTGNTVSGKSSIGCAG